MSDHTRISYGGYTPYWWSEFLNRFALGEMMARLTSEGQAESLARAYLLFGDVQMADAYLNRLREVKFSELPEVARRYMRDMQLAYVGDTVQMRGNS